MSLVFPNRSRSYDERARQVRFTGYDGVFEIGFAVDAAALPAGGRVQPTGEADCLAAFDKHRSAILDAAAKIFSRGSKRLNTIGRADLR